MDLIRDIINTSEVINEYSLDGVTPKLVLCLYNGDYTVVKCMFENVFYWPVDEYIDNNILRNIRLIPLLKPTVVLVREELKIGNDFGVVEVPDITLCVKAKRKKIVASVIKNRFGSRFTLKYRIKDIPSC